MTCEPLLIERAAIAARVISVLVTSDRLSGVSGRYHRGTMIGAEVSTAMIGIADGRDTHRRAGRSGWRRRLVAAPVALVALVLLALAVPRMVGVLLSARSEPVLRKLQDQKPVQIDELRMLADAQRSGQLWLADGRLRTDLGLAYLLLAEKLPRGDMSAGAYLQQAIRSTEGRVGACASQSVRLGAAGLCGSACARLVPARRVVASACYHHRALRAASALVAASHDVSRVAGDVERGPRNDSATDSIRLEGRPCGIDATRGRVEAGRPRACRTLADARRRHRIRGIAEEAVRLSERLRDILTRDRPAVGCSSIARTPPP